MRLVKRTLLWAGRFAFGAVLALAQQPIAVGPDASAGYAPGLVKYFDWYTGKPTGGCTNGTYGACVGHGPQGDTYYFSAWLPNASGLPVTTGLPVVGTINDYSFGPCSGNIGVIQLDTFSWSAPTASHMTLVNCMTSFGTSPGSTNAPSGWNGANTSGDGGTDGTWKSRTPFSKGGILYLPVERQISAGNQSVHDATIIISPDAGKHWCNPYTYFNHSGSPGCDSSNWDATGDAPKCGAASASVPCTDAGYTASSHSSMMWKAMPVKTENWLWVDYGYRDGQSLPPGVTDGCDPATYTCFFMLDGSVARVPNASILDVSAWTYSSGPSTWTATFANRIRVLATTYAGSTTNTFAPVLGGLMWLKEFGSYLMVANIEGYLGVYQSLRIQGPWTPVFSNPLPNYPVNGFDSPAPGLGYTVVSANPPHIQLAIASNSYEGGQGSPQFSLWDLVLGQQYNGEAFQSYNLQRIVSGAGYQFSDSHTPGTFPRKGLALSFDFLDAGVNSGLTNWGSFRDFANGAAVISACDGSYTAPTNCGGMLPTHGTALNNYGINQVYSEYNGHFRTFTDAISLVPANAPAAMQGNGSFSVVGVYRYEGATPYSRCGAMWATGDPTTVGNNMVLMCQVNGKIELDWNRPEETHSQYLANFTFPNTTNWYFIATTVQAQTGCGSNCTPTARVWVGGAVTPGVLVDVNAGVSWTGVLGTPSPLTPSVAARPLVLGLTGYGSSDGSSMTHASMLVYNRVLTYPEVQLMYRSMKAKMAERGATLQ
jgi:hypothetical protein